MGKKILESFDPTQSNLFKIDVKSNIIITHPFELGKCKMQVGFSTALEHNVEANHIRILLNVRIIRDDGTSDMAEFNFEFYFKVMNLKKYYIKEGEDYIFSSQVAIPLVGLSISTARGIIYEKLQNTDWRKVIIPIVSPKLVLEQQFQNK